MLLSSKTLHDVKELAKLQESGLFHIKFHAMEIKPLQSPSTRRISFIYMASFSPSLIYDDASNQVCPVSARVLTP